MIDWLKRDPREAPTVMVGDRPLPLVVRRLHNARRMTLRLAPDGSEVRISIPRWGRTAEALDFARSRADWLAQQLAALPVREPVRAGRPIPYRGEFIEIAHRTDAPRKPRLHDGRVSIGGPAETLEPRLRRWLESEAREHLSQDLVDYCARIELPVPRLSLSNAGRRWGSCSAKGWIRINWRLVMAPDFVRRSVVAHEVAHLVHLDHSPRFHALLGELFEGDIAEANSWLKREGRGLFAQFG
ncbi:MAG: M48 family metallopeptidase [Novosphingobium sp.]|nr:M48 family metallopeptidase [Novosphingobium sp.]MCP5403556.1 M48 family metallopeptidase [Novosphingobium sp.]